MASLYERDAAALSRMSHLRFFPQAVTGGKGSWLVSDDGRRLLDLRDLGEGLVRDNFVR